jgi:uncharacterized protein (TIGR03032 family)
MNTPSERKAIAPPAESAGERPSRPVECRLSESMTAWLAAAGGSLAMTSYQSSRVLFLSVAGKMLVRKFEGPMGMATAGRRLAVAGRRDITLFVNDPRAAANYKPDRPGDYDAVFLPRMTWHVGTIRVHDLAFGASRFWFVNTQYSCLAQLSTEFSFEPHWRPPFISQLAPEDRCHLNGLALVEGKPAYVTALGECDTAQGWRQRRVDGGILMDVRNNAVLLRDLSMPHSPRWHQETLYFLESGRGELCRYDPVKGERITVAVLPGYVRGLTFVGPYAVIGLSRIREKRNFGGTPVETRFPQLRCGVSVVDLRNGQEVAFAEFTSGVTELYDVAFLAGVKSPAIVNLLKRNEHDAVTTPEFADWVRRKGSH